jgi:hypothetical protein
MSLLQILGGNQSTGSLLIQYRYPRQKGTIDIERGELIHARLGPALGVKALYRMASLADGDFEFFSPGREPEERTIDGGLEKHLLEAARHMDELAAYRDQLPDDDTVVSFKPRLGLDLSQVPPSVMEVMASVSKAKVLGDIIDTCQIADLDICRILAMLFKRGILQKSDPSGGAKGQTAVLPKLKNGRK